MTVDREAVAKFGETEEEWVEVEVEVEVEETERRSVWEEEVSRVGIVG